MEPLIILWGSSGAYGTDGSTKANEYRLALELIEEGARQHGFDPHLVLYPGHPDKNGVTKGKLSFPAALSKARDECRTIQPAWIIGRSFGAMLVPAVLACGDKWVQRCRGAVMWGTSFRHYIFRERPTPEDQEQAGKDYENFQTRLAPDYFRTLPEVEGLVETAPCNLRFVRGTKDRYNTLDELRALATIHARAQRAFKRQVIELSGFDHTPTRDKLTESQLQCYFRCLFDTSFDSTAGAP